MTRSSYLCSPFLLFTFLWMIFVEGVNAHEVGPAIADIQFKADATVEMSIEVNLEALLAEVDPSQKNTDDSPQAEQYDIYRSDLPNTLRLEFENFAQAYASAIRFTFDQLTASLTAYSVDIPAVGDIRKSRRSTIHLKADIPRGAKQVQITYPKQFGNIAVKFRHQGEQAQQVHWLTRGKTSPEFALNEKVLPQPWLEVAWSYIALGFEHIIPKGVDHILFVLGLFLLSTRARPLITQVTTFTIAHSITLGLTIYGVVSLSPSIVEPLIALSIAYIGIENIFRGKNSVSRLLVIFAFGLLHGMGFAGVLSEIGLPKADFLTALITFNVGVEFGQLAVIFSALLLVILLRLKGHSRYRQWVIIPGSTLISLIGLYWFLERVEII